LPEFINEILKVSITACQRGLKTAVQLLPDKVEQFLLCRQTLVFFANGLDRLPQFTHSLSGLGADFQDGSRMMR
jgi:hypothetical protein